MRTHDYRFKPSCSKRVYPFKHPITIWLTFLCVLITIFYSACNKAFHYKFSIPKVAYTGHKLRTDGYYYTQSNNSGEYFYFYRNGVFLDVPFNDTSKRQLVFHNLGNYYNTTEQSNWGLYVIVDSSISYQKYENLGTTSHHELLTFNGIVVNDSTFVINYRSSSDNVYNLKVHWIYTFTHANQKPDSTNSITPGP